MRPRYCLLIISMLIAGTACQSSNTISQQPADDLVAEEAGFPDIEVSSVDPATLGEIPSSVLIQPEDLVYQGFFRLPDASGGSDWDYSGHGLTFFPEGDPDGGDDGFPGSLFGFGHDHQLYVSEISIPAPALTDNINDAPTAETLQPFSDLTDGIFVAEEMTIPRAGLEYLPIPEPRLHFTFGQHIQDFEASHGWAELNLSQTNAQGPWVFDGFTNYVTNDYLFEIPSPWAEAIAPGPLLGSGRAREGLWSGRGPALFAYAPADLKNPPPGGDTLTGIIPLLLYGEQEPGLPDIVSTPSQAVQDYREADHWWGGAWLTAGDATAVVFTGTKALGDEWYGFANGVVWEHDCAEQTPSSCPEVPDWPYDNRGFWAEDYQAQIIFYNPVDLVGVARGEAESWEPQPYTIFVVDDYLLAPDLDPSIYKRDLLGAAAFDRAHGILYVIERMADEYKSVIHVWQIAD